jgi:hypothetical protein
MKGTNMKITYLGVTYQCEDINGYVFAPPELMHLNEAASESAEEIYEDALISYYLSPDEMALSDAEKWALVC